MGDHPSPLPKSDTEEQQVKFMHIYELQKSQVNNQNEKDKSINLFTQ